MRIICSLFIILAALSCQAKHYKYDVALCAIFQNEAPYLKEWIEYHRLIGVKRFFLYNHNSTDHYKEVLKPYIKKKIVKLTQWEKRARNLEQWNTIQCNAYNDCINQTRDSVDWLGIIDIDEYIVLTSANSLGEFLAPFFDVAGMAVHWQMFGTSNINRIPQNSLMIEMLTMKANEDYYENHAVKCLIRPRRVSRMDNPHSAHCLSPWFLINSHGQRVAGKDNPILDLDKIRINHYWTRDEHFFNTRKAPKRASWGDRNTKERLHRYNQVEDRIILKHAKELRSKLGLPSSE